MICITPLAHGTSTQLTQLVEDYFIEWLNLHPLQATRLGERCCNHQLEIEISPAHREKNQALQKKYLALAAQVEASNDADRLTLAAFKHTLSERLDSLSFPDHLLPITPQRSLPLELAELGSGISAQLFSTVDDYHTFAERAKRFSLWVEQAIANMRQGMREGITLPQALVVKILPQLAAIAERPLSESIFWRPIATLPANFSVRDKKALKRKYTALINQSLQPAYRKLHRFLSDEYLPRARNTAGYNALPNGAQWYRHLVKRMTTTDLGAEQLHALGLQEMCRIQDEIKKAKTELSYTVELKEFLKEFRQDPALYPFKNEQDIIAAYRKIEARIAPELDKLFRLRPRAQLDIRTIPAYRAASASPHYQRPSADGSRPGVFYFPALNIERYSSHSMEALFLHEGIPGHHYQIALQQELKLPRFRQFSMQPAFGEGWALYVEGLGTELGLYRDPYQRLGRLLAELHRANRLIVDTGLHYYGWSREQAMTWLQDNEGSSEASAANAIERYMAAPAQALAYKVGELKILELKQRSKQTLRDKFDVRDFHDQVLQDGSLPLLLLEQKIERWLEKQQ